MASKLKSFEVPRSILETPGAFPLDSSDLQTVGTSAPQSLFAAVRARRDEFTRKKTIKIKVGSWNVASLSGTDKDLGHWFVKGLGTKGLSKGMNQLQPESSIDLHADKNLESVEDQEERRKRKKSTIPKGDTPAVPHDDEVQLYVLGLQEVVDIASVTEAMKPYTDPNPAKKWKSALRSCLPQGYEKVAEHQLLGLLILIFAAPEIAPTISNVSATSVGTGLMGYLGNKGAVSVRMLFGESTKMTFINCHLAAGADQAALERRIWDTNQILHRTRFSPISLDGEDSTQEEKIGDEDIAFWFGDLNYRLDDIPGEDVRRLLLLHTRNEYDVLNKSRAKIDSELGYITDPSEVDLSKGAEAFNHYEISDIESSAINSAAEPELDPKSDPASLITTLTSLLAHDQLHAQQRQKKAFHEGWREPEIRFLPSYKYDVGSVGMFDSGEKKRSPSWCDRILYRTKTDRLMYEERAAKEAESRKRDEAMQKSGLDTEAAEQDVLFDYDPDTDGLAYNDDYDEDEDSINDAELVQTHDGYEDEIQVEHYVSHQRVLSSDHKPIECTFTVTYDTVIPELKAKIHAEVARELDKAENEARPTITVVTENYTDNYSDAGGEASTDNVTPSTSSDVNCINFGSLRYDVPQTRSITIANTGQLPATFNFVGREAASGPSDNSLISPSWLTISSLDPSSPEHAEYAAPTTDYTLSPGDTHTLHLTAHIGPNDPALVANLNTASATLDDVLILRVAAGRDHFLPLRAVWLQTCFHRSLDELVVAPATGVRSMPRRRNNHDATGTDGVKSRPGQGPGRNSAPPELFALTEAVQILAERAVAEWEMTHSNEAPPWSVLEPKGKTEAAGEEHAWPFSSSTWTLEPGQERDDLKAAVREALDTASPIIASFSDQVSTLIRLEIVAETLVQFLASLRGGIVTPKMWSSIAAQLAQAEKEKREVSPEEMLGIVTEGVGTRPVHSVSLSFVTFMLGRVMGVVAPYPSQARSQVKAGQTTGAGDEEGLRRSDSGRSNAPAPTISTDTTAPTPTQHDADAPQQHEPTSTAAAAAKAKAKATALLSSLSLGRRRRGTSVSSSSASTNTKATISTNTAAMPHADAAQPATAPQDKNNNSAAPDPTAATARRKALLQGYAHLFAPLVIRTEYTHVEVKAASKAASRERERERKVVQRVMVGVLEGSMFNI